MKVNFLKEQGILIVTLKEKDKYYLCPFCDALITDSDEMAKKIVRGEEIDY